MHDEFLTQTLGFDTLLAGQATEVVGYGAGAGVPRGVRRVKVFLGSHGQGLHVHTFLPLTCR